MANRTHVPRCVAQGPGLEAGWVRRRASFVVTARDVDGKRRPSGGDSFRVQVSGPGRVTTGVKDNNDGTYAVFFEPTISGKHTVAVTLAGQHVKGSPFSVPVHPTKVKASECVVVGSALGPRIVAGDTVEARIEAHEQDGQRRTQGGDRVTGTMTAPFLPAPLAATVTDNNDGTYSLSYTPVRSGSCQFALEVDREHVPGSPFVIEVAAGPVDAKQCMCKGDNLNHVVAGNGGTFDLFIRDHFKNPVFIDRDDIAFELDGPGSAKKGVHKDSNDASIFHIKYKVLVAGNYNSIVSVAGMPVYGSPFGLFASPGPLDHATCLVDGTGLKHAVAGDQATFSITARDANNNVINRAGSIFDVQFEGSTTIKPSIRDNHDGTYTVSYTPTTAAEYLVIITSAGKHVEKSPFRLTVSPGVADSRRCVVTGPGSSEGTVGILAKFMLHFHDRKGNALNSSPGGEAIARGWVTTHKGDTKASVTMHNNNDGTFNCSYTMTNDGEYELHVAVHDKEIPSSPLRVAIRPADASSSKCVAVGAGVEGGEAGQRLKFSLESRDAYGNLRKGLTDSVSVKLLGGKPEGPIEVVGKGDGTYAVSYATHRAGHFRLEVVMNGEQVSGSPYSVAIAPAAPKGSKCLAVPAFPTRGTAGEAITYAVQIRDEFGNQRWTTTDRFNVHQNYGPETLETTVNPDGNGVYQITHVAHKAGTFSLSLTAGGEEFQGSPFELTIEPASLKGSECVAHGLSLTYALVGVPGLFFIEPRDAFGNKRPAKKDDFKAELTGPEDVGVIRPVLSHPKNTGVCNVQYICPRKGIYVLKVQGGGEPIQGSPFKINCRPVISGSGIPGADTARIVGDARVAAGEIATFSIEYRDANDSTPRDLTVVSKGPAEIECRVSKRGSGIHTIQAHPTKTGCYELSVMAGKNEIPGSPFPLVVDQSGAVEPSRTKLGDDFKAVVVAGHPNKFTIMACDKHGNKATMGGERFIVKVVSSGMVGVPAPPAIDFTVKDKEDGTYEVLYSTNTPGQLYVAVMLREKVHIRGSPFKINVMAAAAHAPSCYAVGEGVEGVVGAGVTHTFKIKAVDRFGNHREMGGDRFRIHMRGPSIPLCSLTDLGDGTYQAAYEARLSGPHELMVTLNGSAIGGFPKNIQVQRQAGGTAPEEEVSGKRDSVHVVARRPQSMKLEAGDIASMEAAPSSLAAEQAMRPSSMEVNVKNEVPIKKSQRGSLRKQPSTSADELKPRSVTPPSETPPVVLSRRSSGGSASELPADSSQRESNPPKKRSATPPPNLGRSRPTSGSATTKKSGATPPPGEGAPRKSSGQPDPGKRATSGGRGSPSRSGRGSRPGSSKGATTSK